MIIDIHPNKRYLDIWLRNGEEPPDPGWIQAVCPGFETVLWRSGRGDLGNLTAELLRSNR